MEHRASEESGSHSLPQPRQVPRVVNRRRRAGLDLEGDELAAGQLDQKVDFMAPVPLSQVMQAAGEGD